MTKAKLWVRWSWRDLRQRWPLVTAIASIIALGTGTYTALLSTSDWRRLSNDASFELLHTHDLRIELAEGASTDEGRLLDLVASIPHASDVTAARERLRAPLQIAGPANLLVPGEIVGTDIRSGADVDGVAVSDGRALTAADDSAPVAVVDSSFAAANEITVPAEFTVSGGRRVRVVGAGQSPEYFLVTGDAALPFMGHKSYGVLFTTLHTAQALVGAPGQVNDLVLTLRPGADRDQVAAELRQALASQQPPLPAAVTSRENISSYRVLYDDIEGDTKLWRILALLVLAGATFAALNLTTRVVEAQRREIGIGMALGVPSRSLAIRPLLFAAQISLLGAAFGLLVGWALGFPLAGVLKELSPLPVYHTPVQYGLFAQGAVLGFALPFGAAAWPIARALRVEPVQAIRVGHLAARGGGRTPRLPWLRLPGRGYRKIPVRNVLRTPRRSLLTALGVAAAITALVTCVGFLDTFNSMLDRLERELLSSAPDRVTVTLDTFQPRDGDVVRSVAGLPAVGDVQTGLLLPATAEPAGAAIELALEVLAPQAHWRPTLTAGSRTGGIVLAEKAARDLGVEVGDRLEIEHPQLTASGLATTRSRVTVAGLHPNPMRSIAYLGPELAATFGFGGVTNLLSVTPSPTLTFDPAEQVRRALLAVPHVASAQTAQAGVEGMRSSLSELVDIIQIAAAITLLLALLIAFNSTTIGVDERAREHATMLAYGLPARTVLGLTTVEALLIGTVASVAGVAGGYGVLSWVTATTLPEVLPEVGIVAVLAPTTIAASLALSVAAVGLAPLFSARRLRRMDIPATLRVVE